MKRILARFNSFFTTYEKIWFLSILVLAIVFTFLFPETDDPTYTVSFSKESYQVTDTSQAFDILDFSGISDDFVLLSVTIDGEEFTVDKFTKAGEEFTVTPSDPSTLLVRLPRPVTCGDSFAIECYPDGDGTELTCAVRSDAATLFSGTFTVEADVGEAGCSVTENKMFFVSVAVLMALYLADTVLNVACELLIAKQSRWNFLVSLGVEIVEIVICIVCMYRFATMAVTLFFWIPCDIVSFIVWTKHKDKKEDDLTVVKTLKPWQDVLVVVGILVWTVVIGYLLTFIDVNGGVFGNNILIKNIACYLDACVSAVGIVNGLFILFRYREQWFAWYISAILETVINVMAGQYVLLVLKAGYLTNTTYGYIKWTKYIREHKNKLKEQSAGSKD